MRKRIIIISIGIGMVVFIFGISKWAKNLDFDGKITISILAEEGEEIFLSSTMIEQLILNIVKPLPDSNNDTPASTTPQPSDSISQSDSLPQVPAQSSETSTDTASPFLILDSLPEEETTETTSEIDLQANASADLDAFEPPPLREDTLFATDFEDLNLIERGLEAHPFIAEAQITEDLNRNIEIKVYQRRPLARLWTSSRSKTYVVDGQVFSTKILASIPRILIITGVGVDSLRKASFWEGELGRAWYQFLEDIHKDDFLNVMIGEIQIDQNLYLKLYPQLGRQVFHFGYLKDKNIKLEKLKLVYSHIIPKQGWKKYRDIFLDHENRIICR